MKVKCCPICQQNGLRPYGKQLMECPNCTHIVAQEIPSEQELKKFYENEYFFGWEYFDYLADRPALEKNFNKRLKRLGYTFGPKAHIIEIGSAYGYFLNLLKDKVASHKGFEVSEEGVKFASKELKVNSTTKSFIDAKIVKSSVDTVYMWDVIEHLAHPEVFVEKISSILKPKGHTVLTTGDIGAWLPRRRKDNWRLIHPPTHLHYFTPKSIKVLFERNGLKVVSISHKGIHRNFGSVLHQLAHNRKAKNQSPALFQALIAISNTTGLHKLNIPLNTGDIMEVVATKA